MAMLLTNWGDSEDAEPTRRYNLGVASAWVQVRREGDIGEICLGEICLGEICLRVGAGRGKLDLLGSLPLDAAHPLPLQAPG